MTTPTASDAPEIDFEPRRGATLVDPVSHEEVNIVGQPEWTGYALTVLEVLGWVIVAEGWVEDHGEPALVTLRFWEERPEGAKAARDAASLLQLCQRVSGIPAPR